MVGGDRDDRQVWADHRVRLEAGVVPLTTAPVVAEVSHSLRQVQLRRFLRGCDVLGFVGEEAHEVGRLLSEAGASDVVDAHVVLIVGRTSSTVRTSDEGDLQRLSNGLPQPVPIRPVHSGRRRRSR